MPPAKKPLQVTLPTGLAAEIADAARRTQRSTAFIVRRALAAAPKNPGALPPGATTSLALTLEEDDPPNTLAKIKSAAAPQSLDGAIAAAWLATRARFHAFIAREESAASAERADDLDAGLRDARDPKTPLSRLTELAASDYPKIRALVAQHPTTPPALLSRLAEDREPYVREAAARSR